MGTEAPPQNHGDLRRKRPQRGQGATFSRRREWSVSTRSCKIRVTGPSLPRDCDQRLLSQPRGFRVLAMRELAPSPTAPGSLTEPDDEGRLPKRKLQSWNLEIPSPPHSAALVHCYASCYSGRAPRRFSGPCSLLRFRRRLPSQLLPPSSCQRGTSLRKLPHLMPTFALGYFLCPLSPSPHLLRLCGASACPTQTSGGRYSYQPHFTGGEIKANRGLY